MKRYFPAKTEKKASRTFSLDVGQSTVERHRASAVFRAYTSCDGSTRERVMGFGKMAPGVDEGNRVLARAGLRQFPDSLEKPRYRAVHREIAAIPALLPAVRSNVKCSMRHL